MLNKRLTSSLMLVSLLSLNSAFAGTNFTYQQPQYQQPVYNQQQTYQPMTYSANQPLRGSVITVPAGSTFHSTLTSELSSGTAFEGQTINMVLGNDFYYDNKLIAPAGSTVVGSVIQVSRAKHGSMNGKICVRFTQINPPTGSQIPISAVIKTDDNTGVLVGGTKKDVAKEYTKDLAVGSAAGALSGVVFGALAGGSVGKGAALGTAVGAGGGLVKSVWNKGNDVTIPANSTLELELTQPITTSISNSGHNYSFEN